MTHRLCFLDCETFNETPIKHGSYRYSETVEIMLIQYAIDDPLTGEEGPIRVIDLTDGGGVPQELLDTITDPEVIIIGQNFAQFDRIQLDAALGIQIPVEKIEDLMVQAQSHGLPGGLDKLCAIFKVPDALAKHKEGRSLIQLFCCPRPKNSLIRRATKSTHPVEWQRFLNYAGSDISSMRYLRKVMPRWNYPGTPEARTDEYRLWLLDQKINDRGFAVDLNLARGAVDMVERHKKVMARKSFQMTSGEVASTTQRDALLKHLLSEYGVDLPDMQKGTLERRINDENLPWAVRELLALRLEASGTSQAKYQVLLNSVSSDGRLRGTLVFCGAQRTGRYSARGFQPQNLARPTLEAEEIDAGIEAIKSGAGDLLLNKPMEMASNALRGCIVASEGKKLVVADLSNIEGRIAAWLAKEDWQLEAFRAYDAGTGPDLYLIGAGGILGKRPEDVTKDERQAYGKTPFLACQYGGADGAFETMARLLGVDLPYAEVKRIVALWRERNAKIKSYWYKLDDAMREAILQPGIVTKAGRISFHMVGNWLRMKLPSGRLLCYCAAALVEHPFFEGKLAVSYMGVNGYTRQWERILTFGGKTLEQSTQATARDVMTTNFAGVEAEGYELTLSVHDEVICETLDTNHYTSHRLEQLLAATPWWADDSLPLAASGFETKRYAKH